VRGAELAKAPKPGGESTTAHSAERDRDQAAAQQRESGCGKDEKSFGSAVAVVTHDTPVASAPGDGANELIKDFGIDRGRRASRFGTPLVPAKSIRRFREQPLAPQAQFVE
jgi:hypothetical protein